MPNQAIEFVESLMKQLEPTLARHHQQKNEPSSIFEDVMSEINNLINRNIRDENAKEVCKELLLQYYAFEMPLNSGAFLFFQEALNPFRRRMIKNPSALPIIDVSTLAVIERYFYWIVKNIEYPIDLDFFKEQLDLISLESVLVCFGQYFSGLHYDKKNECAEDIVAVYVSTLISICFLRNSMGQFSDFKKNEFLSSWMQYFDHHLDTPLYEVFQKHFDRLTESEHLILLRTLPHFSRPKLDMSIKLFKSLKISEHFNLIDHFKEENAQVEQDASALEENIKEIRAQILKIKRLCDSANPDSIIFQKYTQKIAELDQKITIDIACYITLHTFQVEKIKKILQQKSFEENEWILAKQQLQEKIDMMHLFLIEQGYDETHSEQYDVLSYEYRIGRPYLCGDIFENGVHSLKAFFMVVTSVLKAEKESNAIYLKDEHFKSIFDALNIAKKQLHNEDLISHVLELASCCASKHKKEAKDILNNLMVSCPNPLRVYAQSVKLGFIVNKTNIFPSAPHAMSHFFFFNKFYKDRKKHRSSYIRHEPYEIPLSIQALNLETPAFYPDKARFSSRSAYDLKMSNASFSCEEAIEETYRAITEKCQATKIV